MPQNTTGLRRGVTRSPGRPKGSKNRTPRKFIDAIAHVYQDIHDEDPHVIRKAIKRGIQAKPPQSFAYLQMLMHYERGQPTKRMELGGTDGGPITYQVINRMRSSSGGAG